MTVKIKLISPDHLSDVQRRYFEKYAKEAPQQSVCVNVAVGTEPWDVRPLYLERGRVWIHRYTRALDPDILRNVASEMAGFTVLSQFQLDVRTPAHLDQILLIRPYFQNTLTEMLRDGALDSIKERRAVARSIIEQIGTLIRRNLVHGHLSLSNIAVYEGKAVLLDPRIALINGNIDDGAAPELSTLTPVTQFDPPSSADLFGLGRVLGTLLADSASREERDLMDQLTLPTPRQRPTFAAVEELFNASPQLKVVSGGKAKMAPSGSSSPSGGEPQVRGLSSGFPSVTINWKSAAIAAGILLALLFLMERRFPHMYYELAHYVPLLASDRSPDFERAWESGDKIKMADVAREAILTRDPAAENAIIQSITSGAKAPLPQLEILKRVLDPLWRSELSRRDVRAALCIALGQLVPEALSEVPPLGTLHPAVLFAVAGTAGAKDPSNAPSGLRGIHLDRLTELPEPVGPLFETFGQSGVRELASPAALGLAAIAAGIPSSNAVEAYLSGTEDVQVLLTRVALVAPIIGAHPEIAEQVQAVLKDTGGIVGDALGWFDVEPVAKWGEVPAGQKLGVVLGKVPYPGFDLARYADLLRFPLVSVRKSAAEILSQKVLTEGASNMLAFLSGDQNKLSRAQVVALLSALHLKSDAGSSFISTWFTTMHPDPSSILMLLLSRSNFSNEDVFNLEAASFLRKVEWAASTDMLKLLAFHPEPLARSLAYARLDSGKPDELSILQDRLTQENDPNLKRSIELRVAPQKDPRAQGQGPKTVTTVTPSTPPFPTISSEAKIPF